MAEHDDTQLLGLRGLYVEARRRDERAAARGLRRGSGAQAAPALPWAGQAVFEFRCAAGDWHGASQRSRRTTQRPRRQRTYRRQRAVLLTARAHAIAGNASRTRAKALALEAAKLAPDLVPAASARRAPRDRSWRTRAAPRRFSRRAWRLNPHPDLADTYAHLRTGDSARDRLSRVQIWPRQRPAIAKARSRSRAPRSTRRNSRRARGAQVAPGAADATGRDADGRARRGRARRRRPRSRMDGARLRAARDPAWTADGFVSDRWMPVSPVTGRLDAFEWKVPLAELAHEGVRSRRPGRSTTRPAPLPMRRRRPYSRAGAGERRAVEAPRPRRITRPRDRGQTRCSRRAPAPSCRRAEARAAAVPEAVIPLVPCRLTIPAAGPYAAPAGPADAEQRRMSRPAFRPGRGPARSRGVACAFGPLAAISASG